MRMGIPPPVSGRQDVQDLQDALAEICDQEHSYHYAPPGYHVDEGALDLATFQRLSERFTLIVVQMTGTFDGFTERILEDKIKKLKEKKKNWIALRRTAA